MDLKEEFKSEAMEHLATAEEDVLALEQLDGDSNNETVNRLFRALHTIKGGSACINFFKIKEFAHALENIVGMIRAGTLVPRTEITQLLLDGLDKLKSAVDSGEDAVENSGQIIAQCAQIGESPVEKPAAAEKSAPAAKRIFDVSHYDASAAREQRLCLYEITLDLSAECTRNKCGPSDLAEKIKSVGILLALSPELDAIKGIPSKPFPCSFLLATLIDDPDILFPGLEIEPQSFFKYGPDEIPEYNPASGNAEIKPESVSSEKITEAKVDFVSSFVEAPATEKPVHSTTSSKKSSDDQSIRIPVETIDKLMNLAGELVVVRNRNAQLLASGNIRELSAVNQRLDVVTSEIQATVMRTRMCPVGAVFGRFTRVVRDLGKQLGKEIELETIGADVELDKSIVDGLFDPLTHLIRNSADHGIESAQQREQMGKSPLGHIRLAAMHQTGQVNIQVMDDGKGIDPHVMRQKVVEKGLLTPAQVEAMSDREMINLIFMPGFSTSEKITDVSGRGVGMDAVKSSLQKLGGIVEIQSAAGKGMTVNIRLPLTLAIIPALILTVEDQYFAIPQVNVREVVWLHGDEIYQSIKLIDGKEVYWLRGKMLPLLRLSKILQVRRTYRDPATGKRIPDPRVEAPDQRQSKINVDVNLRTGILDRRTSLNNSIYIIVLQIGGDRFGLCVERIIDTEEIVIKPLHEQLKTSRVYAGVTVLGDGVTAMILDVPELAQVGGVFYNEAKAAPLKIKTSADDKQKMLVFSIGGSERFAIPLSMLMRVDEINSDKIKTGVGHEYICFRESMIPLVRIERVIQGVSCSYKTSSMFAIIPRIGKAIGIAAAEIIGIVEIDNRIELAPPDQNIVIGSQLIDGWVTSIIDICALVERVKPGWFLSEESAKNKNRRIVMVEDSSFFRALLSSYLNGIGLDVLSATNGKEALELIERESASIDGVLSDLEMPVMDGFDLARHIKSSETLRRIPLMAISAMEEFATRPRALDAGFDEFSSKSDFPAIVKAFNSLLTKKPKQR